MLSIKDHLTVLYYFVDTELKKHPTNYQSLERTADPAHRATDKAEGQRIN